MSAPPAANRNAAVAIRRYKVFANPWAQVAISALSVTIAELFQKKGAMATAHLSQRWGWTGLTTLASPFVWVAMGFVILSFITWLYAIKRLPLSVAFPVSQVVHVLIPLGSWLVLAERITPLRWAGIALVLCGVALVARPVARLEEKL